MEVHINIDDKVVGVKNDLVYIDAHHYMNDNNYRVAIFDASKIATLYRVAIPRKMYTDIQNTYLDMKADYCKRYDYFCGEGFITLTVDENKNAISYDVDMEHG